MKNSKSSLPSGANSRNSIFDLYLEGWHSALSYGGKVAPFSGVTVTDVSPSSQTLLPECFSQSTSTA